jgi:hypothetical protein
LYPTFLLRNGNIINRVKRAVREFLEVQINALGEAIKESTESEAIRKSG